MTEATTTEVVKDTTTATDTVDTTTDTQTTATDVSKSAGGDTATKTGTKAGEASKEFVADASKSDEENAAALAEFEKTNSKADAKDEKQSGIPDDWRELAAGGDEDLMKLAKRYGSLRGVLKALDETKKALRSGGNKTAQPDPKDEKAMAEWRKEQGIPDDATGYKLSEAVTKRLTDDDKPVLASFTEFAHTKGARPDVVEIASEWYIDMMDTMDAQRVETDRSDKEAAEDNLRKDWAHGEYKANITLAKNWANTIPGLGEDVLGIRAPDGRLLGSIPEFVTWASDQGRQMFGDSAFATGDSEKKHTARKAEIEGIMKTDIDRYYNEKLDAEYKTILEREEKRAK